MHRVPILAELYPTAWQRLHIVNGLDLLHDIHKPMLSPEGAGHLSCRLPRRKKKVELRGDQTKGNSGTSRAPS